MHLLQLSGIDKSFPGVKALRGAGLTLDTGEVVALMGENGAGKSTLIKILGGAQSHDAGQILLDGQLADLSTPQRAAESGIAIIYQEFNLIPDLTVRENIYLGREKRGRFGLVDADEEHSEATRLLGRIGAEIDPETIVRDLTVAQQQMVEIARALSTEARVLIMDEPTAALGGQEVERLLDIVRDLREDGIAILYVSHRLDEIFAIADRVSVLRDGASVGEAEIGELDRKALIEMMVGRPLDQEYPARRANIGEERLRAENLRRGRAVQDVSLVVHAGEVLGLAGLVGAGRTETARLIFGADVAESGALWIDGQPVQLRSPRDAIRARVCLLTEDRKGQGLVLMHSVQENFGLPNLGRLSGGILLDRSAEAREFADYTDKLQIKIAGPEQAAGTLSGGNQQKVVLAKWLARNADILIFDEPTRGIDVGAKFEIYLLINALVAEGKAIILISSELPEVLGMSDRILVMHEGRVRGEITDVPGTSQNAILSMAISGPPA